jgi:RNA polymerase sigma-70 factor (ECF subfamily)
VSEAPEEVSVGQSVVAADLLVLREIEGLDERAAGELLQISPGTAKSRLSRAKSNFRKAWTS